MALRSPPPSTDASNVSHGGFVQEAEQRLVGIRTLADDLDTRVSALEPLDNDLHGRIALRRGRHLGVVEKHVGIQSAGAPHVEFTLGLGVEVQQDIALQQAPFSPKAPSMPVSSVAVKSASSGPCCSVSSSSTARIDATPMPLSAPASCRRPSPTRRRCRRRSGPSRSRTPCRCSSAEPCPGAPAGSPLAVLHPPASRACARRCCAPRPRGLRDQFMRRVQHVTARSAPRATRARYADDLRKVFPNECRLQRPSDCDSYLSIRF